MDRTYPRKYPNKFEDKILELNGVSKPIRTWAYELKISVLCIRQRLKRGLPMDQVLAPSKRKSIWS
jgi:hypothetical protein